MNEDAMMNQLDPVTAAALAAMHEQLKSLVDSSARNERQLEKLDAIKATVAQLQVSMALKADQTALSAVDAKVVQWIGHFKGALTMATLCVGVIQTAMIGGIAYVVSHIQQNETSIAVIAQRLDSIERNMIRVSPMSKP